MITDIIEEIIKVEGGYSNSPNDSGGETRYGITKKVARKNGYNGDMTNLPIELARKIYYQEYVVLPKFDRVLLLSELIATELVDTGVNMGTNTAAMMLQTCLNAFNRRAELYNDILIDGDIGPATITALASYLKHRRTDGVRVMLKALNCLQGARYIDIAAKHLKNEDFVYGWIDNRVELKY